MKKTSNNTCPNYIVRFIYIYINISRDRDRLVKCVERWARNSLDKTTEGLSDCERRVIVTYCKPISKVVHCFGWIVSEFVVFEACRLLAICLTAVDGNLCKSVNRFTRSDSVRILRGCHSTFYQHFINILSTFYFPSIDLENSI